MAEKSLLTNHPINTTLNNFSRLLGEPSFRDQVNGLEPDHRATVNAIELFVRQTKERIERSSDREVSLSGLRQLASNLQNVWSELSAYSGNNKSGHIVNAANNFDGALNAAAWTFFNRPVQGSRAYGDSIRAVQKASDDAIDRIRNRASGVASRYTEFENKLGTLEQEVAKVEGRLALLSRDSDAQLAEIRADFATIKVQIEQERQADREARAEEFKNFLTKRKVLLSRQ